MQSLHSWSVSKQSNASLTTDQSPIQISSNEVKEVYHSGNFRRNQFKSIPFSSSISFTKTIQRTNVICCRILNWWTMDLIRRFSRNENIENIDHIISLDSCAVKSNSTWIQCNDPSQHSRIKANKLCMTLTDELLDEIHDKNRGTCPWSYLNWMEIRWWI